MRPAALRRARSTVTSSRWWPSTMSSTVSRSSVSATPTGPGARWCNGGIPFHRWVTRRAPASTAARTVSASASVWPTATTTPASVSSRTTSSAPGSSGAIVTIRRASPAASRYAGGLGRARGVQERGGMGAAPCRREPGALEVQSGERAVGDERSEAPQRVFGRGHRPGRDGGDECAGAAGTVVLDDTTGVVGGARGEVVSEGAVGVQVDERGHDDAVVVHVVDVWGPGPGADVRSPRRPGRAASRRRGPHRG